METQIKILKHENKTSKGGKDYTRFNTSIGWVSVFETEIVEEMKKYEGTNRIMSVEVAESDDGKFRNIRKLYGLIAPGLEELEQACEETKKLYKETIEVINPEEFDDYQHTTSKPIKSVYNPTSMYVSYAKDILVAIMQAQGENKSSASANAMMATAIDLVKQAHKSFE